MLINSENKVIKLVVYSNCVTLLHGNFKNQFFQTNFSQNTVCYICNYIKLTQVKYKNILVVWSIFEGWLDQKQTFNLAKI